MFVVDVVELALLLLHAADAAAAMLLLLLQASERTSERASKQTRADAFDCCCNQFASVDANAMIIGLKNGPACNLL